MKLVIEIPEEEYQTYINHTEAILDSSIPLVHQDLLRAVINGTPLPKGHGRLKDENEIKQMIEAAKVENEPSKNFAENIIKFAPTIIEADEA